jgi:hypothetical protein
LRIKEQETRLTFQEHDDDDDISYKHSGLNHVSVKNLKDNKLAVVAYLTVYKKGGDAGKPVTNVGVTTKDNFPSNKYFVTLRGLCRTA